MNETKLQDEMAVEPAQRDQMVAVAYDRGTIESVKRVVFPGATDDELRIYMYKCLIVGVHPLSGMLIPVKYNTQDGAKLSFTTTIDCFRAKAQESGEYDGQDEPAWEGEDSFEYEGQSIVHPVYATVNVYRKGISRPFVGTARWSEYYPGHKRGSMWRKMPRTMLAKCAEALALRKGFPEKLGRVYAVEEMDQAAESQASAGASSKPAVRMPRVKPAAAIAAPTDRPEESKPDEEARKARGLISDKQVGRLFGIAKKAGFSDDEIALFLRLRYSVDHAWQLSWKGGDNSTYNRACGAFEKNAKAVRQYLDANAPTPNQAENMSDPSFADIAREKAAENGLTTDQAIRDAMIETLDLDLPLEQVPPDRMGDVLAMLDALANQQTPGA